MASETITRERRLVSKADLLSVLPPGRKGSPVLVRVVVERGSIALKSLKSFRKGKIDSKHSLKVVWVSDLIDDELGQIKNCFVVVTPEKNYILQADSHRMKIEWMQSLSIAISQSLKFRGSYRPSNWSNLEDLHQWLMVREVSYEFREHDVYKGALYSGKWNMGMPHICGRVKWPNGNSYDGEFVDGKFQGSGTMMWLSHSKYRHYTGNWQAGLIEGYGEMIFSDQSIYTGWWHMGMRHGHGRMEYREENSMYTGGWELDKREGYGVLDNKEKLERYLGMWQGDRTHGAGIQVAGNKYQFSGSFVDGERSYDVTRSMRKRSISVVQDNKWNALFQSTAAMLEQMVSIAHYEVFMELTIPKSPFICTDADSAVAMDFSDISQSLEGDWDARMSLVPTPSNRCRSCPGHYIEEEEEEGEGQGGPCAVCRIEGFKSVDHPFGLLLNILTKCFIESYSGIAVHVNLLPHAISELCSIATRLHQLVRKFCPSLITTDEDMLQGKPKTQLSMYVKKTRNKLSRIRSFYDDPPPTDYTWLYPIMLPSIFPALFTLYKEHYSRDDHKISHVISTLDRHSDEELSGILEVRTYLERWRNTSTPTSPSNCFTREDRRFSDYLQGAIKIFRTIIDYNTPGNKLVCIQEVEKELSQFLFSMDQEGSEQLHSSASGSTGFYLEAEDPDGELLSGRESECESDEIDGIPVGLFTFIIVRSRVEHLYSEIQFIQDFSGSTLLQAKYGSLLSTLRESYHQMLELNL